MFIWIVLWLVITIGLISFYKWDWDYSQRAGITAGVCALIAFLLLIPIVIVTADGLAEKQDLHSQVVGISTKSVQRDALVKLLQSQLKEFPAFATDVAGALDAKIIIAAYPVLGSDVYLAKTNQIVSLNVDIAKLYNDYYKTQAKICAYQGNPMIPKTVWYPHCHIANWDQLELPPLSIVHG